MGAGNKLSRALPLIALPLLALFGGYLVDATALNIANIQTMKAKSLQPPTSLTTWGDCRQAHIFGRNLLLQGRYDEALPPLQEGAVCSDDAWAWYDLGRAQYALGDLGGAAESWRHTEEGYNEAARLALIATQAGDKAAAQAAWEFAIEVDPASHMPYVQLARLAADSEPERVEPLLQQAVAANPNAPEAYIELGRYYQEAGDGVAAQTQYEQALALDPTNISLLVALAENAAELGDTPAAIDYWQEVALRNERRRATAYYRIGDLALNDNNYSSAAAFFRRAVETEPENGQFLLGLARAYFALGCRQEATDAYQALLATAESQAITDEAQQKLVELAAMSNDTIPCPDGS